MTWNRRRAPRTTVAEFSAADAELGEVLDNLDDAGNYVAWIFELVAPHLGDDVLELGAGHGTFTEILAKTAKRVVTSDVSERCVGILRNRFTGNSSVEVVFGSIG